MQHAHLVQAHARQAVRTRIPTIDGQTAEGLRAELATQAQLDQPAELQQLYADMARTCTALATAREAPNWHAVRLKAIRQAGAWVRRGEELLAARKKQETQDDAKTWKIGAKRRQLEERGGPTNGPNHPRRGTPMRSSTAKGR